MMPWTLTFLFLFLVSGEFIQADSVRITYIRNNLEAEAVPENPIETFDPKDLTTDLGDGGVIHIFPDKKHQAIVGFGAAFSEIDTLAVAGLDPDQKKSLITHLFNTEQGAGFQMCRLPVGSSDFATSAYSYDDTPEDYEMKAFSIARDNQSIIPVAQLALQENPALLFFASPWSPPGWMKKSGRIDQNLKDGVIRDEDRVYQAYALYLQKYLLSYLDHGIMIQRLCPQNEMDAAPGYPGCLFPPPQMTKFVTQYLAPQFKEDGVKTEIWPGTFREKPQTPWAEECLKDENFRAIISGLGIQYYNGKSIDHLAEQYPHLRFMFTEAPCDDGKNTVKQTRARLGQIIGALANGCDSFAYWNMILDENQKSGWGWRQNSLVTIDRTAKTFRYNPDFQPMTLVSRSVRPGDIFLETHYAGGKDSLQTSAAFLQQDGTLVILAQNLKTKPVKVSLEIGTRTLLVTLPPEADCSVEFSPMTQAESP